MERGGNYEQQNQGMPIGNQTYGGYQPNNLDMVPNQKRTSDTLATVSLVIGISSLVGFYWCSYKQFEVNNCSMERINSWCSRKLIN